MKIKFLAILIVSIFLFTVETVNAQQQLKIGIFDIDLMVRVLPEYASVDSLVQLYDQDSLGVQYDNFVSQYKKLDSTYKADSAGAAEGKISKASWDSTSKQRQQVVSYLLNWQQIAQYNEQAKRQRLAQPLYQKVTDAYKKVLDTKKYNLILRPQYIELGTSVVDNLFVAVARELKLTSLPPELLQLGNDPDASKTNSGTNTAPKTNQGGTQQNKKP